MVFGLCSWQNRLLRRDRQKLIIRLNCGNIRYSYMTLDEIISSVFDIPSSTQITLTVFRFKIRKWNRYMVYIGWIKAILKLVCFQLMVCQRDWFIRMNLTLTIKSEYLDLRSFEVTWGLNLYLILGCHVKS